MASALLGAAAGALTAGRLADKIGRIAVMKIAAVLFLISAFGTGFAHRTCGPVVVFRIIGGIGVGVASVIAPAYIAETSPPGIRGRLGSLQQLAIVSGIFLSFASIACCGAAGGPNETLWFGLDAWRWMFLAMALPAVLYGVLAFTIPESPRYLVASHKIPEARRVLCCCSAEEPRNHHHPDPGNAGTRGQAVVARHAQADRRASTASSGWASDCRSSSSSSAST